MPVPTSGCRRVGSRVRPDPKGRCWPQELHRTFLHWVGKERRVRAPQLSPKQTPPTSKPGSWPTPMLASPKPHHFPVLFLFLRATCTPVEIPATAQANTNVPGSNGNLHVPLCFQQNEEGKKTHGQRLR